MSRWFNISGPCDARWHYLLPPEGRLPNLDRFIDRFEYFSLRAPRQSGKTTAMLALADRLRNDGHLAVHTTFEACRSMTRVEDAEPLWIDAVYRAAARDLAGPDRPMPHVATTPVGARLSAFLDAWSRSVWPRRVVLLLDEADVVSGNAMVNLLGQLRSGFHDRLQGGFPSSIVLIGLRDMRDYSTANPDGALSTARSAFNVRAASVTLANFSLSDVGTLYAQHTAATGQPFADAAADRAFELTGGQPFLVNALAREIVDNIVPDRSTVITLVHVDEARDRLIRARTTHLENLADRLREGRIARTVAAIILGDAGCELRTDSPDFRYAQDLGLVARGPEGIGAANPIYREVLIRELSMRVQDNIGSPSWRWTRPSGALDFPALMVAFQAWWRENAEILTQSEDKPYREAAAHLAFMAFLQRLVDGGGQVTRECASGRGRLDILVTYGQQRFAVEIKRVTAAGPSMEHVQRDGMAQLAGYLDTLDLVEGWLLIFDQRPRRSWQDRIWQREEQHQGKRLVLVGG